MGTGAFHERYLNEYRLEPLTGKPPYPEAQPPHVLEPDYALAM